MKKQSYYGSRKEKIFNKYWKLTEKELRKMVEENTESHENFMKFLRGEQVTDEETLYRYKLQQGKNQISFYESEKNIYEEAFFLFSVKKMKCFMLENLDTGVTVFM